VSLEANREALRRLENLLRRFQLGLSEVTDTARFMRSENRSTEFCERMRRSEQYLELALDAMEGRTVEGQMDEETHEVKGWLRTRLGGLVTHLTAGALHGEREESHDPGADDSSAQDGPDGTTPEGEVVHVCGDGRALGVPDLLATLQAHGKTGVLRVEHPDETIVLHIDGGELVHAYSECSPAGVRLGEILVAQGALTEERLQSVLFCHVASPRKIGEILRLGEVVSEEQLHAAVGYQIQELFHRLWSRPEATYRFDPVLPSSSDEGAKWSLTSLLLESACRSDERDRGEQRRAS